MSRLNAIENWNELAREADYHAARLAGLCGVSLRQLQRYFIAEMGTQPQDWLNGLRMRKAVVLIARGSSVKEAAFQLGYKQVSYFSRVFKQTHGLAPALMRANTRQLRYVAQRYEKSLEDIPVRLNSRCGKGLMRM